MKKTTWLMWILFTAVSMGLRLWQTLAGYEDSGLAKADFLPGILLPAVLLAATVFLALSARGLPNRRTEGQRLGVDFRFADNMPAVFCAVTGSFLVMLGGGLFAVSAAGSLMRLLPALLVVLSGGCALYMAFALYRENDPQGLALLVPICALIVLLVYVYRTNASDPVLMRSYIETLAVAALTASTTLRAAFYYGGSNPRRYVPVSALSALLSLTAAAEGGSLAYAALFVGYAAIELSYLAAANFSTQG
ncbi:MAG: hypothetical protein K6G54_05135 [Oscillospiraceae bacterium]|nr:hypothetical protein [Oscillospiraceae bacterium]